MSIKQKVMYRLAYHYLKVAGIEIEPGETYDANKIAIGLSRLYKECKKDEEEVKKRITIAGEFFNSRGLSWTPMAVWRDWEMIQKWSQNGTKNERILHDSTKAICRNGIWYDSNNPNVKIDLSYYPELGKDV